jgi:DNA repair exonuclease SbcCD nuclease subunit
MERRAAIGDIHLSGFESDHLDNTGLPFRLSQMIKSLDFIIEECKKRSVYHIDILGDLINDKSIIYTVAQDAFNDFLKRNSDFYFRIISGNHDMSSTGQLQKSAITVFDTYDNVDCIPYVPMVLDGITYVPYTSEFLDILKNIEPGNILISHLGLNEAMLQSGLSKVDRITMKDLASKFKLAILGHYHKPQFLYNDQIKVYYAGNLSPNSWNDKNEQKRFLIYNILTLEVESIPILGQKEFKEFVINTPDQKDQVLQQAEIAKNNGHVVRIKNKSGEKIRDEVSNDVLLIETNEVDITNRGIEITQTREEQLKKYLEIKGIPEDERQEYLDVLLKYNILTKNVSGE